MSAAINPEIANLGSFIFNPCSHLGVGIALPALFSHPRVSYLDELLWKRP
jgi:hypothetical protein